MSGDERTLRQPPFDEELEKGTIGILLMPPLTSGGPDSVAKARHELGLKPEHFYSPIYRALAEMIFAQADKEEPYDVFAVSQLIRARGLTGEIPADVLDGCVTAAPSSGHLEFCVEGMLRHWKSRMAIDIGRELVDAGYKGENPDEALRKLPDAVSSVVAGKTEEIPNEQVLATALDGWRDAQRRRAAGETNVLAGLPTPWAVMDQLTSGWQPGLIILAGRPSAGKSTMEGMIADHLAEKGHAVGRVALDMNPAYCLKRSACRMAGVSISKLDQGFANRSDMTKMEAAAQRLSELPIYLWNHSTYLEDICLWAKVMKVKRNIRMLTVDFATLIHVRGQLKYMNRNDEIGVITGRLKKLSFELEIPVLLLSQLSRGVEKEGREPKLSDLRDSGNIEQDAALVWFLYTNPGQSHTQENEYLRTRNVWVHLMKQQNGAVGAIPFKLYEKYFKFEHEPRGFGDNTRQAYQGDDDTGGRGSEQLDMEA